MGILSVIVQGVTAGTVHFSRRNTRVEIHHIYLFTSFHVLSFVSCKCSNLRQASAQCDHMLRQRAKLFVYVLVYTYSVSKDSKSRNVDSCSELLCSVFQGLN